MDIQTFATINQYEARFGEVTNKDLLSECLDDASAAIRAALDKAGIGYKDPDEDFADRLMRVCRACANRIMPQDQGVWDMPAGVTNASITGGPYSQSFTFATSYGTPRLLPSELELLGVRKGNARILQPSYGGDCHD